MQRASDPMQHCHRHPSNLTPPLDRLGLVVVNARVLGIGYRLLHDLAAGAEHAAEALAA